jgi:hypothetical protein
MPELTRRHEELSDGRTAIVLAWALADLRKQDNGRLVLMPPKTSTAAGFAGLGTVFDRKQVVAILHTLLPLDMG